MLGRFGPSPGPSMPLDKPNMTNVTHSHLDALEVPSLPKFNPVNVAAAEFFDIYDPMVDSAVQTEPTDDHLAVPAMPAPTSVEAVFQDEDQPPQRQSCLSWSRMATCFLSKTRRDAAAVARVLDVMEAIRNNQAEFRESIRDAIQEVLHRDGIQPSLCPRRSSDDALDLNVAD